MPCIVDRREPTITTPRLVVKNETDGSENLVLITMGTLVEIIGNLDLKLGSASINNRIRLDTNKIINTNRFSFNNLIISIFFIASFTEGLSGKQVLLYSTKGMRV